MAILVTGAAGFIGYHVADRLLAAGETVIGIDSLDAYYDPALKRARLAELARHGARGAFHQVDFADADALDAALADVAVDRIVHLGAQAGVRHSIDHPRAYVRANMAGHLNLLELARARQVRHMVYASSSSVYGGNPSPFAVGDRVDRPISLYAASKRACELMSETYAHIHHVPLTGLRFFTVYGPWGRPDMALWLFTAAILEGRPLRLFNAGRMRRDFTYVDDIASGVIAALARPPADDGAPKPGGSTGPHTLYNLGNHRAEDVGDVVRLIEQACGRTAIIDPQPVQPGDVLETFADIAETVRDLGYRPATRIEEGVPRFVRWYRNYTGQ